METDKTATPTFRPTDTVIATAQRWLAPVRERLAEDFVSACITGGALQPDFDPSHRRVNVLVVARALPLARLDALATVLPRAHAADRVDPLFMSLDQVHRSLDVFPIEWLDLSERHWLLAGDDLFRTLQVPHTFLRLQVEQELRGKHLRLTQAYLRTAERAEDLHAALAASASGFLTLFRALLRLKGETPPVDLEHTFARVAALYGLDAAALAGAHRMRALPRHPGLDDARATFRAFLVQVDRLAGAVDALHGS